MHRGSRSRSRPKKRRRYSRSRSRSHSRSRSRSRRRSRHARRSGSKAASHGHGVSLPRSTPMPNPWAGYSSFAPMDPRFSNPAMLGHFYNPGLQFMPGMGMPTMAGMAGTAAKGTIPSSTFPTPFSPAASVSGGFAGAPPAHTPITDGTPFNGKSLKLRGYQWYRYHDNNLLHDELDTSTEGIYLMCIGTGVPVKDSAGNAWLRGLGARLHRTSVKESLTLVKPLQIQSIFVNPQSVSISGSCRQNQSSENPEKIFSGISQSTFTQEALRKHPELDLNDPRVDAAFRIVHAWAQGKKVYRALLCLDIPDRTSTWKRNQLQYNYMAVGLCDESEAFTDVFLATSATCLPTCAGIDLFDHVEAESAAAVKNSLLKRGKPQKSTVVVTVVVPVSESFGAPPIYTSPKPGECTIRLTDKKDLFVKIVVQMLVTIATNEHPVLNFMSPSRSPSPDSDTNFFDQYL